MEQKLKDFPGIVSLTVTNRCNLRCRMCAQWSEEGYMRNRNSNDSYSGNVLSYDNWCKIVNEVHDHDYPIGNAAESTLHQIWHSDRARKFREIRSKREMPVCYRCGAKYMGRTFPK